MFDVKMTGLVLRRKHLLLAPLLCSVCLSAPVNAQSDGLSKAELMQQCRPLLEGSQSLMAAFQSGQCSSYILGIYDLVARQCPDLPLPRAQAVTATVKHLPSLSAHQPPAVQISDYFRRQHPQCLPMASL